uniref:Tail protein n=1 Tax=viral metagenome TaxID=1070528 RepID=A0A6H1Z9C1_9ZZZZ
MKTIKISAEDFPAAVYAEVERFNKELVKAMRITAARSLGVVMEKINTAKPHSPVDNGLYRASWAVENHDDGATMYNPLIYAGIMELGRRAGRRPPPRDVIKRWVRRKFKIKVPKNETEESVLNHLAMIVQMNIARRGIKGRRPLARAMVNIRKIAKTEIDAAAARVASAAGSTGTP